MFYSQFVTMRSKCCQDALCSAKIDWLFTTFGQLVEYIYSMLQFPRRILLLLKQTHKLIGVLELSHVQSLVLLADSTDLFFFYFPARVIT